MPRLTRAERRCRLARQTLQAFATIGFVPPTARDLRDVLHISIGGIYSSFASKEELAYEVVSTALEDFRSALFAHLSSYPPDVTPRLHALVDWLGRHEVEWLARVLWITDFIRAAWNHRDARLDEVRWLLDEHHQAIADELGLDLERTIDVFAALDGAVIARAMTRGRLDLNVVRDWLEDMAKKEPLPNSAEGDGAYTLPGIKWWEFYARRRPVRPGGTRYPARGWCAKFAEPPD